MMGVSVAFPRARCTPVVFLPRNIQQHVCRVSYYDILEVNVEADQEEIKAAFRRKAKLLHPDVNPASDAADAFRSLVRAHKVLSNSVSRQEYDLQLDLPSAKASDPRFARFHRWRREVVPDLEVVLDEWTGQVAAIVDAAEKELWSKEDLFMQLLREQGAADDKHRAGSANEAAAAVISSMQGVLKDAVANIQRQYDKRYEQIQVRYPAYPDLVWYDLWLEASDGWLAAATKLTAMWGPRIAAAESSASDTDTRKESSE